MQNGHKTKMQNCATKDRKKLMESDGKRSVEFYCIDAVNERCLNIWLKIIWLVNLTKDK